MAVDQNVELVRESVRRFKPETLNEWAKLWSPDDALGVAGLEK